jgi:phosphonate transport system substrate-binding protein
MAMSYDNPRWRPLMDLEGLKRWVPADPATMKGYDVLSEAVEAQGLAQSWQ